MLRKTILAAFLATTCLTAKPAEALPLQAFFLGLTAPTAINAAVASVFNVGGFFQVGAFLGGTLAGQVLLSIGLNAALSALAPRPQAPEPSARMANFAQPVTYAEWPVGRTRKGGPLGFTGFGTGASDSTKRRYYSVILSATPIEGVVTHYLDDRETIINGSGIVQTAPMTNMGRINFQNGQSNTADADLVSVFSEITSSYDFAGLAVAHLWAKRPAPEDFSEIYPNGRQWTYAPLIDGANNVYDPRTQTYGFTRNFALNTAYWITQIIGREVDWDEVAEEADASDVLVTNGDGGQQPKWQLDGTFSDDEEYEAQRNKIALAGDAWFYERPDGKVGFKVGRYIKPTITLTDVDFYQVDLTQGFWGRNAPTTITARYTEPSQKWVEAPSGTLVLSSDTREVRDEILLYMVASHNQAIRCIDRIAKLKRAEWRLQGTITEKGDDLIGHRFVRVQVLGKDLVFEVQELKRNEGGGTFDILASSVNEADFDFDAAANEPTRPEFDQVVSDNSVPNVTGFTGTAQDGGSIKFEWDATDSSLTQRLRIRPSGDTDWTTISIPSGNSSYTANGLADGVTYEAEIQNLTAAQRTGAWTTPTLSVTVVANSTAPAAITSFATSESSGTVTVSFNAPNDENYYATRIYRADYSAGYSGPYDIGDASVIRTEYGIPSNADSYDDTGLSTGHYAYWGAPINPSGVEGTASGPSTEDVA